jgi:predicted molibdopterin-dependent oxidoreductase YjgC
VSLFQTLPGGTAPAVTIEFEGQPLQVPGGVPLAAALLAGGVETFRTTPVTGAPRGPYCMMGVCFECLVEVDGVPSRQACLVAVREGMKVCRQQGARDVGDEAA